jgi:pyruvate ferredoxin oxidoreductase beta subunit/2-oxoisovalerate ferredoxin oxidoreductase beta subunit
MVTEVTSKYTKEEYMYTPPGEANAACPGCGAILALRIILKALGEKVVFVMMAGCATGFHKFRPLGLSYKGQPIAKAGAPFGQAGIHAGGIKSALTHRGDTETQVVVFAGDGATFDLGLAGVSAAAERNEDIIYVCYDNEQYMNTGRHRSSATPWQAATTTSPLPTPKQEQKKDIMSIIAASHVPYAATATVAYPDDLLRKVQKAKGMKGFRFLHILTPCPVGWQYPTKSGIEMSRMAVETKIFPLYEVEHGFDYTINKEPKGLPVEDYVSLQTRTRHLTPHQREEFQGMVEQRWERLQLLAGIRK